MYSEDGMRVLAQYRKAEAHKAELKRQEMRRARFKKIINDIKSGNVKFEADKNEVKSPEV
jgi:hypothetical protein